MRSLLCGSTFTMQHKVSFAAVLVRIFYSISIHCSWMIRQSTEVIITSIDQIIFQTKADYLPYPLQKTQSGWGVCKRGEVEPPSLFGELSHTTGWSHRHTHTRRNNLQWRLLWLIGDDLRRRLEICGQVLCMCSCLCAHACALCTCVCACVCALVCVRRFYPCASCHLLSCLNHEHRNVWGKVDESLCWLSHPLSSLSNELGGVRLVGVGGGVR